MVFLLQNNHHEHNITAKMKSLRGKVSDLEKAAAQRKAKLDENSAFLQFNWKADVVKSWIGTCQLCQALPASPGQVGKRGSSSHPEWEQEEASQDPLSPVSSSDPPAAFSASRNRRGLKDFKYRHF